MKDKIEAQKEVKAKDSEEKEMVAQQVYFLHFLIYFLLYQLSNFAYCMYSVPFFVSTFAEHVRAIVTSCIAGSSWYGWSWDEWFFWATTPNGFARDASYATLWYASNGKLLSIFCVVIRGFVVI